MAGVELRAGRSKVDVSCLQHGVRKADSIWAAEVQM